MGRILLALPAALCTALLGAPASAVTPEFQITPRAGVGSLKVEKFIDVNESVIDRDTFGLGVSFGYLTPIGVVVELGADNFGDFDFFNTFDSYSLTQTFASLGYQFDVGNDWRLVPRAGRAHWKLRNEDGRLFNPGPEGTRDVSGDGYFWELGVAHRISSVVTLGVNYKQGNFDFGRSRSAAFTVTLGF